MRSARLGQLALDFRRFRRSGHHDLHATSTTLDPDCRAGLPNILEIQRQRNLLDASAMAGLLTRMG
jgi:hypothetical protein